jgi:hypothetical protein
LLLEGDVRQVACPIVMDMYEFCSDEMKKQLDGPREAVRHEEDRKANADRAVKKAKKVCCACIASLVHVTCCHVLSSKCCEQKTPSWVYIRHALRRTSEVAAVKQSAWVWEHALPNLNMWMPAGWIAKIGNHLSCNFEQEESDAQYKNKGKKGSKAETSSKAESTSTAAADTSAVAPQADSSKDVEMIDSSEPSSSSDRKHIGEMTGGPLLAQRCSRV